MKSNIPFEEIAEVIMGQSPAAEDVNHEGLGIPLLSGPTEFDDHHPKPVQFTTNPNRLAKKGDLLFCVRGSTTGKMNWADQEYAIGRGIAAIRHRSNPELNYFVKGIVDANLKFILQNATGSTFPNVTAKQLYSVKVSDGLDQKEIAKILGDLDHKIELNRKMNETLEQMGQALFKNYFFDNPERNNWKDGTISNLVNIDSGYAFKRDVFDDKGRYGLVTIKNVQDGFFIEECKDFINDGVKNIPEYCFLKPKDVLLSLTGNIGRVCFITEGDLLLNQRVAKLTSIKLGSNSLAYFMFREPSLKDLLMSISRGTAQLNLSPVETKNLKIKVPPETETKLFIESVDPVYNSLVKNSIENSRLVRLRDLILPKLIAGDINV